MTITFLNILILLIMPFIMTGVIKKTKAFWAGRKGVSVLQPLYDFIRLMNKEPVYSDTVSWVFKFTPVIMLSAVIFAALFAPLADGRAVINAPCAFIIFSYSLGLGKFFQLISAMDTGSSFEGMGASREACFSALIEPAFFIAMGSIAALTEVSSFENLKMISEHSGIYGIVITALLIAALFIMLLTEGSRVPVDDPVTHLELTMIHEAMILDNSGADLAFIMWASQIKMFLISSLIAALVIPAGLSAAAVIPLFICAVIIISAAIGTIEASMARFRMTHVFEFVFTMTIAALLACAFITYKIYGI